MSRTHSHDQDSTSTRQLQGVPPPLVRSLDDLTLTKFDVLIIGAGIYGAWMALDAAQRGLSVALIDKGDFGGATSANSQHVVHGGLRYLQHADFKRMRESIRERRQLFQMFPKLIAPKPFIVPTFGWGLQSKPLLKLALGINDFFSYDRNQDVEPTCHLPSSYTINLEEFSQRVPDFNMPGLSGGAVYHDGLAHDSERVMMALLRAAVAAGATLANYCAAERFQVEGDKVTGAQSHDLLSGTRINLQARLVITSMGPWTGEALRDLLPGNRKNTSKDQSDQFNVIRAVVLVTKQILPDYGLAIPDAGGYQDRNEVVSKGFRNLFIVPWRGRSLLGTFYEPYRGIADELELRAQDIQNYLEHWNKAYPAAPLKYEDVYYAKVGLLPQSPGTPPEETQLEKQYVILDHEAGNGPGGLISVVGVKWTTARDVAEKAIDLAGRKLGIPYESSGSQNSSLDGTGSNDAHADISQSSEGLGVGRATLRRWATMYGSGSRELLELCNENAGWAEEIVKSAAITRAEVVHAVRSEAAYMLTDVVFRRCGIGTIGYPGADVVRGIADQMAEELGWSDQECGRQIDMLAQDYENKGIQVDA